MIYFLNISLYKITQLLESDIRPTGWTLPFTPRKKTICINIFLRNYPSLPRPYDHNLWREMIMEQQKAKLQGNKQGSDKNLQLIDKDVLEKLVEEKVGALVGERVKISERDAIAINEISSLLEKLPEQQSQKNTKR